MIVSPFRLSRAIISTHNRVEGRPKGRLRIGTLRRGLHESTPTADEEATCAMVEAEGRGVGVAHVDVLDSVCRVLVVVSVRDVFGPITADDLVRPPEGHPS